ncbi:MAG: hypothetical protein KKA28_19295 [Planctomycetes bacterium]|nr:hypothetical protein [Planctomycetota bacterium]
MISKDKYKPIYYALLSLLGSEYQDKFKKMGNELTETVQEVIKEIEKMVI